MKIFLEQLSHILIFAGIAQGFFIAFLLNGRSVRRSRANFFLSVLLIALSFSIAHILYAGSIVTHLSVQVYSLGDPTFFLIAPLLWFYTRELTGQRIKWSWKVALHFLPFFLIIIFSLSFRSISPGPLILFLDHHHRLVNIFFWITMVLQFSCYQIFIHRKWVAYKQLMQQEVSNIEDVSISWVRFFMGVFLAINLFFLFSLFAVIHLDYDFWLNKSIALIFSLSIFALGYKGLLQKEIFLKEEKLSSDIKMEPLHDMVTSKPDQELINKLLAYMEEKKPYLDPELTLSQLAKYMSISRSQLSQLINDGIGDNFYNFINKYRVEQVKKLMTDPQVKNYNMLGLALDAGFKSKSTFNLIFKRFTGLTPTEYRKNLSR